MRDTKFTPGPWEVDGEKLMRQQLAMGGIAVKAYSKRYDAYVALTNLSANETFGGADEAVANANLIAAVTDLYDACCNALSAGVPAEVAKHLREAIAKAEGQS